MRPIVIAWLLLVGVILGQEMPQGPHHAVVIGVDRAQGIAALKFAESDARRCASELEKQGWRVRLLVRGGEHEPLTGEIVLNHILEVARQVPSTGSVLVYFSGHGGQVNQRSYLFAQATHPDRLEKTGISVEQVLATLQKESKDQRPRFRSILLVDACRNPVGTKGGQGAAWDHLVLSEGHGALFGTQSGKTSEEVTVPFEFEGDRISGGLFTHFLVKSLTSPEADQNQDGFITLNEVESLVGQKMTALRDRTRIEQKPHLIFSGSGQLVLACAPRDVTPPVIEITSPANGAQVKRGYITIRGKATDGGGVSRVVVYVDDLPGRSIDRPSAEWSMSVELLLGRHRISAQALDRAGNASEHSLVTVDVGEITPAVEPRRPAAGGRKVLSGLTWARTNTQGYEEYTLNKDPSVVMILIPGGTFTMGSTDSDAEDDEKPLTRVTLSSYLIGKHELTWGQYKKFCRESGHAMPKSPSFSIDDSHPVVNVSWNDGVAYGKWSGFWRSEEHPGLPTEAEWEYAARGPEGRKWPWGSTNPDSDRNLANGSGKEDGHAFTAAVGSFPRGAGPFGTLDQAGNVREWCADGYGGYPGGSVTNPTGPKSASRRVNRGGNFYVVAGYLRGSYRSRTTPGGRADYMGFRLASQVTP